MQQTSLIEVNKRKFLSEDFNVESWEQLEKYYTNLYNRDISSFDKFENWLANWDEFSAVIGEDLRWKYINTSINTADEEAQKIMQNFYINIEPKMKPWENKLQQKFNESPFKKDLSPKFINFKRGIEADLELFTEKNIDLQKELSILEQEYAKISGAWSITYKGKDYTMPQANKFLLSTDRKEREDVYRLIIERVYADNEKLNDLMDKLVEKRHQIALNAGFENYRDYMFKAKHRFDYTVSDCEDFHRSVATQIIPLVKVLDEERKKELGYETLKPWDTSVDPLNREPLKPFKDTDEFVSKTVACFNKLDPYFGAAIAEMNEIGRLDLESRKAKAPGGYMMAMPESGIPFIFMNHAASEGDVRVMVHEGGHAIHGFLAHSIPESSLRQTPSEMAELASMSMELFSLENWENFYENEEDLNRAKKNHLSGLLNTLIGVAKGDEFQHWMYTNPKHTAKDRNEKWLELQEKYGTGVVDSSEFKDYNSTSFQRILHFYQVPFYYIEYGFAQLGAIAMWKNYKNNPKKTIEDYKNALALGYTKTLPELYEVAGIKFDFSKEYVHQLADFLENEIGKLN